MSDKKQKFIITQGGKFRQGRVQLHMDLQRDGDKAIGGGWWYWDRDENVLYLYALSVDFGPVTQEQIDEVMDQIKVRYFVDSKVIFTSPLDALKLKGVLILHGKTAEQADEIINKNDYV